jgi:ATP-dependent Clp protease ATP-binding subunit ClpC
LASKRGTLSSKKITIELAQALQQAAAFMQRRKQPVLNPQTLLLAFISTPDTDAHRLLRQFSQQNGFNWDSFTRDAERAVSDARTPRDEQFDFVTGAGQTLSLGEEILVIIDEGLGLAESQGQSQCGSAHALSVMARIELSTHWQLSRRNITDRAVLAQLNTVAAAPVDSGVRGGSKAKSIIYHRQELEAKLLNLLSMRRQRNVILVGQNGSGRRSLVLGAAQTMAQGGGPAGLNSVVELDERALLDNPLAEVTNRVRRARGGILFVPDIDRFFGGIRADFREEAGNALQKAFLDEGVVIVGTTTEDGYTKKLNTARVITEGSHLLRVPPASLEETINILTAVKPKFEADYQITILDQSLAEATRLAGRYYTVKPLPGAAIDLLHRACAAVGASHRGTASAPDDKQLDPDDVMITASLLTGIPANTMGADERKRYLNMASELQRRIIGQDSAVMSISRAVKMARVGLKDPRRPIGSFLFLGPTGVGKSELAKALAEFMFGAERALITLDMSEYMEPSSVNRLIGSPPGYVGHESGGQLTDSVKKQPYSVVLFDEVEKADRKVFDTLLQVMDEGRLTSGQGETVSFSECVILMTSNIGGEHLADARLSDNLSGSGEAEYNLAHMRALLEGGFSSMELLTIFEPEGLFTYTPAAESVENPAGDDDAQVRAQIVDQLLEQAGQKSQFDLVLQLAESRNPTKYEEHLPYFNWAVATQRAEAKLKAHFRPEFLNRLDEIIYFHPLNNEHLFKILDLLLKKEAALLAPQGLGLEVTEKAKKWLLQQNDHPEWGARPLRRIIQRNIREQVAEYLLSQSPTPGTVMKVQEKKGKLTIQN